jgi:hypothetical protein
LQQSNQQNISNMPRGNPQNLSKYQWKKGQSGNPKGRPKKLPDLKEVLINVLAETKEGRSALEAVLMTMRAKALKGDTRAAELLLDRAYGKAKQENDVLATFTQVIMPLPPAEEVIEIGQGSSHEIERSADPIKLERENEDED